MNDDPEIGGCALSEWEEWFSIIGEYLGEGVFRGLIVSMALPVDNTVRLRSSTVSHMSLWGQGRA